MIHSGGGLMSLKSAAEFPVRLLESGPAGGAVYASHVAARFGLDKVLSFDMGGTTAKICLIEEQHPKTARTFEVARFKSSTRYRKTRMTRLLTKTKKRSGFSKPSTGKLLANRLCLRRRQQRNLAAR
jgi:N-methylhydantoinase A/oxoprolinase/acetone carboxylase beta subunit